MGRCLGANVAEGKSLFVLINDVGCNFPPDNFTEYGVVSHGIHFIRIFATLACQVTQYIYRSLCQGNTVSQTRLALSMFELSGDQYLFRLGGLRAFFIPCTMWLTAALN